jgi:ribose/xylose/arabinose/galactoside ABC-type transport system permease subunit
MTSADAPASPDAVQPDAIGGEAVSRGGVSGRVQSLVWRALLSPEISLVLAIVILSAIIQSQNPVFLTFDNLILVLKAASPTFVMAVGMTFVLIAGGIDLSVGSMSALGGVVAAWALTTGGMPIPVAVVLSLAACTAIGLIFGTLISWARIPPLIVTLGGLYAVRGIVLIGTGGVMIFPLPDDYIHLGQGSLYGIPFLVIYAVVIGLAAHVLLEHSKYGFHVRAVGGNRTAARAAGINVRRVTTSVFVLSAAGAALGGMMISAKTAVGDSASGQGSELAVITSVIVGGASLFGAVGSIAGTALGVFLIAIITNGLLLMRISSYWQFLVLGIVVISAVGIDSLRRQFAWSR